MGIKINNPASMASFDGPSQDYYKTQDRFKSILEQKLNGTSRNKVATQTADFNYDSKDVTVKSYATAEQIEEKLLGTDLEGLGQAFAAAESKSGVNAWFLTALAMHESGDGTSRISKEKNNLFGFQAYDSTPYASAKTFQTKADSIEYVANYLSKEYLDSSGKYYNGESIDAIGKRYATDTNWSNAIKARLMTLSKA